MWYLVIHVIQLGGGLLLPPISSNDSNFVPHDPSQPSLFLFWPQKKWIFLIPKTFHSLFSSAGNFVRQERAAELAAWSDPLPSCPTVSTTRPSRLTRSFSSLSSVHLSVSLSPKCLLVSPCPSHQPPPCPVFPTLSTSMSSLPTTMFSLPTTIFSLSTSLSVPCPVFPPRARLRTHYRPGLCPKNHIKTGGL